MVIGAINHLGQKNIWVKQGISDSFERKLACYLRGEKNSFSGYIRILVLIQ